MLISSSEYGSFVAGYEMISACKVANVTQSNDVHYVSIIDHAVGTLYAYAHNYLFQQVYCGLNDARKDNTGVKFYSWHIDTTLGECIVFETNDTMENLRGAFDDFNVIPPSQTGTSLCKKLETAKKCASSVPHDQKVEIAIPLLLHETLGKCDFEHVFGFSNQKMVIFWTYDYYQPRNLPSFSSNVEFVMFGAAQDFLPQENWMPNEEMINASKNGKSNMVKALNLRFQQMIGIKKKNIGEGFKRKRTTTTTFAPSKPTTAKIINAAFNILPFFQPKPVKVQQLTTIPAPSEIHENYNQSVIADTMPLVVGGNSKDIGKRLERPFDRKQPNNLSKSQKDNSSEVKTNETYSSTESDIILLTTIPTIAAAKAEEENGFFESFGEFIGDREYGAFYFFAIILALVAVLLLFLFLMWCCCIRESTKGKYEVWEKGNRPLADEPDPEAGIAYPGRSVEASKQPLLKASVSRESIKAENPAKASFLYLILNILIFFRFQNLCDDPFGTPQPSTPASPSGHPTSPASIFAPLCSPAPLTLHSQTSQIADTHPLKFRTERDETQPIPELKVPSADASDENLWLNDTRVKQK
uniref:Uncharacterized protein n=1 Tax=Panagrolaimus davidi TaxID=227884 RepID=A0A914PR61_9BILA